MSPNEVTLAPGIHHSAQPQPPGYGGASSGFGLTGRTHQNATSHEAPWQSPEQSATQPKVAGVHYICW